MKIKCNYCGAYIDDTEENCPNCGAVNEHLQRQAVGVPKTIEELKQWYLEHNLPDEDVTRFFIGRNYTSPKAFGIYQEDDGNFIVYKNKANGVRVIRYRGKDEAYAVNELYMRLKEEIVNQKQNNLNKAQNVGKVKKNSENYIITGCFVAYVIIILLPILMPLIMAITSAIFPSEGYYYYDYTYYYRQGFTWYEYDDSTGWFKSSAPSELSDNYSSYYRSENYRTGYDIEDFSDTSYYDSGSLISDWFDSDSDWDWDSDSSWDSSDSWDSSSTDWDSDW